MAQAVASMEAHRNSHEVGQIVLIDIGRVMPNPLNPRGEVAEDDCLELAASIRANGILQPLLVTPYRAAYYLVAGHRRQVGAKLAGLTVVPCIVQPMDESLQLDFMLVENIQRKALSPVQEARAFQQMVDRDRTIRDIVEHVGVSSTYIRTRLAILRLDQAVLRLIERGLLPLYAAPILVKVTDAELQRRYATLAVQGQMPAAKLEKLVEDGLNRPARKFYDRKPAKSRVLGEREMFARSQALTELTREGQITSVSVSSIADAFNDVCDGLCTESESPETCEACPAPRLIASLLKRSGVDITGRVVN